MLRKSDAKDYAKTCERAKLLNADEGKKDKTFCINKYFTL